MRTSFAAYNSNQELENRSNCSAPRTCLTFVRAAAMAFLLFASGTIAFGQANVTMHHNDIGRTGANTNETILTPANVSSNAFARLFILHVDGRVYAQPLYLSNVTMGAGTPQAGTTHNVVFVATQHDSVYAFDADSNGGANASPLWQITLLNSAHGATGTATSVPQPDVTTTDIVPEIGITSTGAIDLNTKTLYIVGKIKQTSGTVGSLTCSSGTPCYVQQLHALDVTTGLEKFGGPVRLSGTVSGNGNGSKSGVLNFDPLWENNRPGLLLLNGIVYIGFAAHGDNGPWHGWILAYNASTLAQTGVWCASPNGIGSGIWMSGAGLAADLPTGVPFGRMFLATGNGDYTTGAPPYTNSTDYGDSIVRLSLNNGVPQVSDEFTPLNQSGLNSADEDVASGGVLLLPDQTAGGHTHELIQVGKEGKVYVVDRDTMGGYSTSVDNNVQEVTGQTGGLWSMPAYWNGNVYFWGSTKKLTAFSFVNGRLSTTPTSSSSPTSGFPGATPSISSNGTSNGIVWAIRDESYNSNGPAVLYAFDANNVATLLYASNVDSTDAAGAATKFVVPTIANGKVFVGTATEVDVYGLSGSSTQTATPSISPAGQSFTGTLNVTITDSTPGATIYYTTNGNTPTTSSTVYSGAIQVTTTETIKAIANAGAGFLQSSVASQAYTLQTQTLAPTFSPASGVYSSSQAVTISDASSGAKIYYTTNGSNPSTSSTLYTAPVSVTATTTINAIAVATGLTNSPISTATYTITAGGTGINYSNGFSSSASTMTFNGSTGLDDTRLQLTDGGTNEAGSAFVNTPVNIQSFTTDFAFQLSNADGDGITFTIQGSGPTALGPMGGGLGYGPDNPSGAAGIPKSVAIKFDLYSNNGEGDDSTGLYTNGASPTTPSIDLTSSGIDLHNGDTMAVHMTYDGTTLAMTITDAIVNKTYSTSWAVNIPSIVGGNTAYIGFTGGTGGSTSSQKIESWTLVSGGTIPTPPTTAATPTFSPVGGTYLGSQSVTISDTTSGAKIYYTTDGSTPSTSSALYSAPISVTLSETIKAIAAATGSTNSAVGMSAYTIESQVPPPTFSPAGGIYSTSQTVTISDSTAGATIYYTTNGTTPSTSSTKYTGPITVAATETVQAIATASGYFNSNPAVAAYTIGSSITTVNLGSGFSAGSMALNGNATLNGTRLRITDASTTNEVSSAWYIAPANIQQFTNNFTFQISGGTTPQADGFAFVIQGGSNTALGPFGGGLGYGPDTPTGVAGIPNSVAIKFDLYSNVGEGIDSTGLYTNGSSPTTPSLDLTSTGINLHSPDVFNVRMTYDGTNLAMTITDTVTQATYTHTWAINIPATVGGNAAYVGFTGGTGGSTAIQEIIGWTMTSGSTQSATATPTFTPVAGTYSATQSVTISDATSGATIYYTTNNTAPTTGSTKYTGAISVASSQTIQAIATAAGFSNSAVAAAAYSITTTAAAPVISPATGTYSSAQTVSISDSTAGATIRYTTDGSQPTTTSPVYSSSFIVSATTTVRALAIATGFTTSATTTSVITIGTTPVGINFGSGFTAGGLALNGNAALNGTRLRLTDTGTNETASAWYTTPVNIQTFTTDFTFQLTSPIGNGITFAIQNAGSTALGPAGGGLGYGPDNVTGASASTNTPIAKSVAVKFDIHNNAGEGPNSTGLYLNGASPTMPATTLGGGVNLVSGDIMKVHVTYDGTTLTMTITDAVNAAQAFTASWPVNIPGAVGGNTALLGFTGATGASTAIQEIITWTYSSSVSASKTPIVYSTTALTAVSSGPAFRIFQYAGFPDGNGTTLDSTKVGDNVTFTVNVPTAGTYDVKLSFKDYYTRGISQLAINGTNFGAPLDQYIATDSFASIDYGTFNFPTSGNYSFKYTITGKNASSGGYTVAFDDITLTPQ